MRIGIIGSGNIGGTLARLWAQCGHEVALARHSGPDALRGLVAELGEPARAGTVEEAARFGEVVLVATPLGAYAELPADALAGKVVIDAGNYYPRRDGPIAELDDDSTTSTEWLAGYIPESRVVKAFNTMNFRQLGSQGRPEAPREERLAIFVAGNDAEAKEVVSGLIEELGFAAVDTGSLAAGGRRQQPGSAIYGQDLRAPEAEAAVR